MTDTESAGCWLRRNNLGWVTVTPTLAERLAARRHGTRVEVAVVAAGIVVLLASGLVQGLAGIGLARTPLAGIVVFSSSMLVLVLGAWLGMRVRQHGEREVAARMRTRAAHSGGRSAGRVLGKYYATVAVVTHLLGLALGIGVLVTSDERAVGVAFTLAVAVLGVVGCALLVDVVHRPALATGPESLTVDDVLRTRDARRAVAPYPAIVALAGGVSSAPGTPVVYWMAAYGTVATALWAVAEMLTKRSAGWTSR